MSPMGWTDRLVSVEYSSLVGETERKGAAMAVMRWIEVDFHLPRGILTIPNSGRSAVIL